MNAWSEVLPRQRPRIGSERLMTKTAQASLAELLTLQKQIKEESDKLYRSSDVQIMENSILWIQYLCHEARRELNNYKLEVSA